MDAERLQKRALTVERKADILCRAKLKGRAPGRGDVDA
jgi:hypothetical protein